MIKDHKTKNREEKAEEKTNGQVQEKIENEEIKKQKENVEELEDKYKRALADYQNLEKRVREERIDWIKTANKELLLRLLPVLDTLLLAQKHSQDKNLEISAAQFLGVLKSEGVEKIVTEGQEFNPITMECIATQEGGEGKVVAELRPGYLLNDVVLRVAQVKVGKI